MRTKNSESKNAEPGEAVNAALSAGDGKGGITAWQSIASTKTVATRSWQITISGIKPCPSRPWGYSPKCCPSTMAGSSQRKVFRRSARKAPMLFWQLSGSLRTQGSLRSRKLRYWFCPEYLLRAQVPVRQKSKWRNVPYQSCRSRSLCVSEIRSFRRICANGRSPRVCPHGNNTLHTIEKAGCRTGDRSICQSCLSVFHGHFLSAQFIQSILHTCCHHGVTDKDDSAVSK